MCTFPVRVVLWLFYVKNCLTILLAANIRGGERRKAVVAAMIVGFVFRVMWWAVVAARSVISVVVARMFGVKPRMVSVMLA